MDGVVNLGRGVDPTGISRLETEKKAEDLTMSIRPIIIQIRNKVILSSCHM